MPAGPFERTLLCLGDSHTEAIYGTNWVGRLREAVGNKLRVVRAGKSASPPRAGAACVCGGGGPRRQRRT
jgi:hypothetical protein